MLIGICVLPGLLIAAGVEFGGGERHPFIPVDGEVDIDEIFLALHGNFTHTILEWTASMVALFTVLLAFAHFMIRRDVVTPVIAVALFWSGTMDAFHTLAADRMIDATAPNEALIPFTWAICRTFNAIIPITAMAMAVLASKKNVDSWLRRSPWVVAAIGLTLGGLAYAIIHYSATSATLPQTMFPDALVSRPWDLYPLGVYMMSGFLIYPMLVRKAHSYFAVALWLSVLPDIATQLYMAFGSEMLFDSYFNAAHLLKVTAYLVPCMGLVLDYIRTYQQLETEVQHRRRAEATLQLQAQELYASNQALDEARRVAEQASRAKAEFLANMSHEIRTPLNGVVGMISALQHTELDDEQRDMVEAASISATDLMTITNDVLDMSKIDAGKLQIENIPFALEPMLRASARLFDSYDTPEVAFRVDIAGDLPARVVGDPTRIRQIVTNYLSNAFKFTDRGEVVLRVTCEYRSSDTAIVSMAVSDTGIGISADRLDCIFDKFIQADTSTSRRFGGTGLGLAICRRLAELMGGTVGAESREGQGSTFWFRAPFEIPEDRPADGDASAARGPGADGGPFGLELLVVEDNAINRKVIRMMLERLGCTMTFAEHGLRALELFAGRSYDAILMDCYMPVMDGFAATAELRKQEARAGSHTPIVALTASALLEDRDRCLQSGMDAVLTKPIVFDRLREVLGQFVRGRAPGCE